MKDRQRAILAEVDNLRREANRLERTAFRHDDCIMLSKLDALVERHLMGFCIGMVVGIVVTVLRFKA